MFDGRELLSDVESMEDGANLIMIVSPVEDRIRANLFDNIGLGTRSGGGGVLANSIKSRDNERANIDRI